jgi:hypothetical protein
MARVMNRPPESAQWARRVAQWLHCSVCSAGSRSAAGFPAPGSPEFYPVTAGGKPSAAPKGLVCPTCLLEAHKLRRHAENPPTRIRLSGHALTRFRQQRAGNPLSSKEARSLICAHLNRARKIILSEPVTGQRLTGDGPGKVLYLYVSSIFVLTQNGPRTVVTLCLTWGMEVGWDSSFADMITSSPVGKAPDWATVGITTRSNGARRSSARTARSVDSRHDGAPHDRTGGALADTWRAALVWQAPKASAASRRNNSKGRDSSFRQVTRKPSLVPYSISRSAFCAV